MRMKRFDLAAIGESLGESRRDLVRRVLPPQQLRCAYRNSGLPGDAHQKKGWWGSRGLDDSRGTQRTNDHVINLNSPITPEASSVDDAF